jgi:hypothetical protein
MGSMGKWVTIKPGASFLAITCVRTRDDFVRVLELGGIDLILSDFDLPASDGCRNRAHQMVDYTFYLRFRFTCGRTSHRFVQVRRNRFCF